MKKFFVLLTMLSFMVVGCSSSSTTSPSKPETTGAGMPDKTKGKGDMGKSPTTSMGTAPKKMKPEATEIPPKVTPTIPDPAPKPESAPKKDDKKEEKKDDKKDDKKDK
jgi:hypothetical protein